MKNPPKFTVAATSITGQSLFQWKEKSGDIFPQSLQMPTEIAEYLAGLADRNDKLRIALSSLAVRVEEAEEAFAKHGHPLSANCAEMIQARKVLD